MNVIEIIKEAVRNAILGGLSYLLTEGVINSLILASIGDKLDMQYVITITAVLAWVLRGVEKQLHEADSRIQLPI